MTNRLTISDDIQLFFRPEGTAWYSSTSEKLPEQIEEIVCEWQDDNPGHPQFEFSEKWLESYEAPDRRKQELLRELRGAYDKFREHMTRKLLETGVPKQMVDERVRKMVEVIISEHNQELLPDSDTEE